MATAQNTDPTYLRLCRAKTPVITTDKTPFEIGKAITMFNTDKDPEVGIISTGFLTHTALKVAQEFEDKGIRVEVLHIHTIKPIDKQGIIKLAEKSGAIVTVEEHQKAGGLGSAVSEILTQNVPVPQEFVGVDDEYGQSGDGPELLEHYGLDEKAIVKAVKKVLSRK
jgi:transketolase